MHLHSNSALPVTDEERYRRLGADLKFNKEELLCVLVSGNLGPTRCQHYITYLSNPKFAYFHRSPIAKK